MMNIKKLISASMVAVALSGCQREAVKPNVLFILVDDMQADAIAALGNRDTYTPNIDRLINEGMAFTRTYTNGALCGALSMPSRAMLLTGRGVFEVQSDGMKIPVSQITLPEHLKNNGYRTFATGNDIQTMLRLLVPLPKEIISFSEECILMKKMDIVLLAYIILTRLENMMSRLCRAKLFFENVC